MDIHVLMFPWFLTTYGKFENMGSAIAVGFIAYALAKKRTARFLSGASHLPSSHHIDRRLVLGSLVFGTGWSLTGFCPGPALVCMAAQQDKALVFVLAIVFGMIAYEVAQCFVHFTKQP